MTTIVQAVLILIWAFIAYADSILHFAHLYVPTVSGFVVGVILGDPVAGLIIGGTCELIFIGIYPVGGAVPPDPIAGTIVAAAIAIPLGMTAAMAVPLAVPVALLASRVAIPVYTANAAFIHRADAYNERGEFGKAYVMHYLGGVWQYGAMAIVVFAGVVLGAVPIQALLAWVDANAPSLWGALGVGANLMVPVGLATLLTLYWNVRYIPLFLLGFVLAGCLGLGVVPVAIVGGVFAIMYYAIWAAPKPTQTDGGTEKAEKKLTSSDMRAAFFRHYFLQNSWCFERMQTLGYYYAIMPIVEKLYSKEEAIERGKMHLEFYNTNPDASALIFGMNIAMEEQHADMDAIRGIKNGLIGALAGIGDSLFGFAGRSIIVSIGAALALTGNVLGVVVIVVLGFLYMGLAKWYFQAYGYKMGVGIVDEMRTGGIDRITTSIGLLGSATIGGIAATWVSATTPIVYGIVNVQAVLDGILPKMLPLAFTVLAVTLIRRGWGLGKTLMLFFFIGLFLGYIGILA